MTDPDRLAKAHLMLAELGVTVAELHAGRRSIADSGSASTSLTSLPPQGLAHAAPTATTGYGWPPRGATDGSYEAGSGGLAVRLVFVRRPRVTAAGVGLAVLLAFALHLTVWSMLAQWVFAGYG